MTDKIDDGGHAFPATGNPDWDQFMRGMSLRDWYAGMALQTLLIGTPEETAKFAYEIADAMIKAGKLGGEGK